MKLPIKIPFYIRLAFTVISLIGITYIIYMGKSILIPILLAFLFAVMLLPIVHFLNSKLRFPNILSSSIAVLIFIILILGIFAFIAYQVSDVANDFEDIKKNINIFILETQQFIRTNFHLSLWEQRKYMEDVTLDSVKKGKETLGTTLMSITDTLLDITLIPIYTFLILLYRTHFILFLTKLFRNEFHEKLQEILTQIKSAIQSYVSGLILEMIAVSILTSIGLYFIGVEYYILLGIITGILNLIPYVGILVAGMLTILSSLTGTPDLSIVIGVIGVNVVVQLIDNNLLVPLIINTKVQINAFVSIVGIIVGGGIAGIAGMFLAIPVLAILKIVFDRIDSLEAWGYLMGDHLPKTFAWQNKKSPLYNSETATKINIQFNTEITNSSFAENISESDENPKL